MQSASPCSTSSRRGAQQLHTPTTPVHTLARGRARVVTHVFDGVSKFFQGFADGSWAPRSTRAWRQGEYNYEASTRGDEAPPLPPTTSDREVDGSGFDAAPISGSFSDVEDGALAAALSRRVEQIATTTGPYGSEVTEEEMRQELTGAELRQLLMQKYGKLYDVSVVRRDLPGKTFVSVNIMWTHLEQKSFKLTEEQYLEKLDGVAYLVGALGQTDKVRAFLKAPARSQNGLPPRPVVGTAISIRLDLEQSVIDEWFGKGYQ